MQLSHEHYDPLFFRIDDEFGVEESSPAVLTGRPEFEKRRLNSIEAEAQTEIHVTYFSQLILAQKLDGFAAQKLSNSQFAAVELHLAEPNVIGGGGYEA